jgi:putative phage-type endonuclease
MKKPQFVQKLQDDSIEQRTEEWYKRRTTMITASDCGVILGYNSKFTTTEDLLTVKLNNVRLDNVHLRHGNHYEPIAIEIFEKKYEEKVWPVGLLTHKNKKYKYLGASPDGVTSKHCLVEIKCPSMRMIDGSISLHYYAQVQLQLEVADFELCYFYECSFKEVSTKGECKNKVHRGYNEEKKNWWYLAYDYLRPINRDRKWFEDNKEKFKNFYDEMIYQQNQQKRINRNSRKRRRPPSLMNGGQTKRRRISSRKKIKNIPWINEGKIRNYCIGDTLCDWLEMYGSENKYQKEPNNPFTLLKFKKTNQFKSKVMNTIEKKFKNNCKRLPQNYGNYTYDLIRLTTDYMNQGIKIIINGMLQYEDDKIYTVFDLLVRSDYIENVFDKRKFKASVKKQFKADSTYSQKHDEEWFYIAVSIKYKILPFSSNGMTLTNESVMKLYKAQSAFKNKILTKNQVHQSDITFIIGSGWRMTKNGQKFRNNKYKDWSRPGYVNLTNQDKNYVEIIDNALIWYRDVEKNGKKWKVEPKPTRTELYPLILSNSPGYWGAAKKKIATNLKEISLLWQVGPSNRKKAHEKNIYTWDDPKLNPQILGFKKNTQRANILQKIIDVNKMKKTKLLPKKIENNLDNWKNPNRVEFYVDFETLNSLYGGKSIIYLIGLTVVIPNKIKKKFHTNNKKRYYDFKAESLTKAEEYRIIEEWLNQMKSVLTKYNLKRKDVNCYCWSNAENSFLNSARKRHGKENSSKWKVNFTDVMELIKSEPVVIKDCLSGFGLKSVSGAMNKHGMINKKYDTKCSSGEVSMAFAVNYYEHKCQKEMDDIVGYNELDCDVIYEILTYLRKNHS